LKIIFNKEMTMNWQKKLNQEGYRLTRPRRVVMTILEQAAIPLSPQNIHKRAQAIQKEIGLVSVYRTLELLTDLALVRRMHGSNGCHGYVLASPGHHHHIICEKAIEFEGAGDLSSLLMRIRRQTGFKIDEHLLQLYGVCPACQKYHPSLSQGEKNEQK
jgi:Fur family ferric uptake transcriptional regulator